MKKLIIFLIVLGLCIPTFAIDPKRKGVKFEEEDGSPSKYFRRVKVPNTSITDNLDGTGSIDFVGGTLPTTYLKLDCSNDPLTATLDLNGNNLDNIGVIYGNSTYTRIGDANTTSHSLASEDDLEVTGKLEVNGRAYFDNFSFFYNTLYLDDAVALAFGASADAAIFWSTAQTAATDALLIKLGVTSKNLLIVDAATAHLSFDHSNQANPTLFINSVTSPDSANDEWISFTHNQTDGLINVGSGGIRMGAIDSVKTLFGTAADASIYYDGNDMIIDPQEVGTGRINVLGEMTINTNSTTALLVEQDGVKDNTLVVDTTNGIVGIGGAPSAGFALHVPGTVLANNMQLVPTGEIRSDRFRALGVAGLSILDDDGVTTHVFVEDTTGNVGIGEVAPQDKLEVNGTGLFKDKLKFTQDDGNEYIDSLNDGYLDIAATTAIRLGNGGTTNFLKVEPDGTVEFNGTATVWNDMQFQVSSAKTNPANVSPTWETFTATTSEYAFSVNDEVDTYSNEIPHSWKQGTAGHAHMHITTKAVPAQEQKAQFTITFAYADTDEAWVEAPLTAELTIPISTTALTNFYLDLGDLTLTNYLIEAQIRCRVKRVAKSAGGTEYVGDIFITQVGIHFEENTLGSRTETTK